MKKSIEEEIMKKAQEVRGTARYMASFEDLVEERIRKAREKGAFNNLEGQGKPLNLYENPFEPEDMRMVNKILKDHGFTPFWIELGKEIDADIDNLWKGVEKFKNIMRIVRKDDGSNDEKLLKDKLKFMVETRKQMESINKKIDNYNCHCPLWWLGRGRLNINAEMEKVETMLGATNNHIQNGS